MPILYLGTISTDRSRQRLYTPDLLPVVGAFKEFRKLGLRPPKSGEWYVAKVYHLEDKKMTALVWLNEVDEPQTVYLNGLLNRFDAITAARMHFSSLIPNPVIFRLTEKIHVR